MLTYLILLFTILPAMELAVLIKVGSRIGAGSTILLIILTGVAGASLARYQGFVVLRKIQENLRQGILPSAALLDGALILAGGILLLTPGFITDILGMLFLIPLTRALIKIWARKIIQSMIARGQIIQHSSGKPRGDSFTHYDDIDIQP